MYSFLISIAALVVGYLVYGLLVDRVFGANPSRRTPANTMADGVDYLKMPTWKVYMIQFLNIAGTGPIFGAIMGAKFGPSCYLWIVLGSIFAGAVHDYLSGMLSIRNNGVGLPELVGLYLGKQAKRMMLLCSVFLLLLVGAVFIYSPAMILTGMSNFTGDKSATVMIWILIIFAYYMVACLLPIDKIIGRIYPIFAIAILFMAVGMCFCLLRMWPDLPEFWDGLGNRARSLGVNQPIFPCLFITVACGAISGFHATQSPMMARCIDNEKHGRPVFYGSMITEGIVALIWATVSSYFFFGGGAETFPESVKAAPEIVTAVSYKWLGTFGGILALIGVVAAPITTGDTAFRSARLIISDALKISQEKGRQRLLMAAPIFAISGIFLWFNISNEDAFNVIWRYFGWFNQMLACFVLWMETAYFMKEGRKKYAFLITLIPSVIMTSVCVTFICVDKIGFGIPESYIPLIVSLTVILCLSCFVYAWHNNKKKQL